MMVFDVKPDSDPRRLDAVLRLQEGQQAQRVGLAGCHGAARPRSGAQGFDRYETFLPLFRRRREHKVKLMDLLEELAHVGHSIAGYGASGRANTMIQYCGITTTSRLHDRRCTRQSRVLHAGIALRDPSGRLDGRMHRTTC